LTLLRLIDAMTDALGRAIAWLMPLMVLGTVAIVLVRYGTGANTILLQESVMYMHAFAFMLAIPYALKHGAHVRVDLVYGRLGPRGRAWVDLAGHLLFLTPTALVILVYTRVYVSNSWRILETSPEAGGLPAVFVLKTLIPAMAVLLLVQGIAEIIRQIAALTGRHD
jgi:TRAP-type mannitol/chloroaromatic compound transport system permease small subunit